ncbi:NIPSNAP family protein [Pelagibacterium luteolum]|uniref:NIPSNAP protein n=1 Tax=Pelagibacterium luteolum TaxID=440168 RepID=A0A1G7YK94_9HYPH|nr:NIPSNAP family protein [Pelagibacterium luteolum]SDG96804.1 NIPSNAP protein [Pelagibacterium luteolum]
MIHERRVYHAAPKKVGQVVQRFEKHTLPAFERAGIRAIAAWTVMVGQANDQFVYVLEWESLAEREQKWVAFTQDEEFQRAWAETDKDGPLVRYASNEFLVPVLNKLSK